MNIEERIAQSPVVDPIVIARYYLRCELPNIFPSLSSSEIEKDLSQLSEEQLWRLLEALSFSYRLNGIFRSIGNQGLNWHQMTLETNSILITGINPQVNKVLYLEGHDNRRPNAFAAYLRQYFEAHPAGDDPEALNEFRPQLQPVTNQTIVAVYHQDKNEIHCLDGAHRLMEMVQQGEKTVTTYVAIPNGKPLKDRVGESTFLLLRKLYEDHPKQHNAIEAVTLLLGQNAADGREAIAEYWGAHCRDKMVVAAGKRLVSAIEQAE